MIIASYSPDEEFLNEQFDNENEFHSDSQNFSDEELQDENWGEFSDEELKGN